MESETRKLAVLWLMLLWTVTKQGSAILTVRQGRLVSGSSEVFPITGIATVELGGSAASRPSYYFDCITNRNNGSGIRWSRMSTLHPFQVMDIPDGSPGKRLDAAGIDYLDLDIYTCSDRNSDDVTSVNITACNPAIMAAMDTVGVIQGLTVQLEVYVSGYPVPVSSQITWYRPDGTEILDSEARVVFQDSKRRLILSNVQPQQAGSYECEVIISLTPYMGVFTSIQLEVYVPSIFSNQPQEILDAVEWTEVTLNCSASGSPIPLITWQREGRTHLPVGAQTSSTTNGNTITSQLSFTMVRYEHRGRYRCVADNIKTNPVMSQYVDIRITPALRLVDDRMQPVSDLYSVANEERVRLECFGTGNLRWTSSTGLDIPQAGSGNMYQSYDHTRDALTLIIQNFTSITIAIYTCATNLTDAHNTPISTSVLITSSNPAVIIQSQVQYVLADSSTTLEARVFASPLNQALVQWYHEGRLIDDTTETSYTAGSSGDIYRLTVSEVSENEVGEYSIVVTLDGSNATDTITLLFPDPPSAIITPSSISVSEGEEVRLTCDAQGSGALTVTWTMSDSSPLPVGVQENGNSIFIASATSTHPGTYVCSVSNLAGMDRDEATLTVYYSPTAVISYNRTMSTPGQQLYLIFDDGAPGPTITCSSDGHLPPTVEWIKDNGRGLPHGISQNVPSNGVAAQLTWQREMEFTDSGSYICQASNNNGTSSARLELLVQIEPTIGSIYPFSSDIEQGSQTYSFTVPINYVGRTLVCAAKGWPLPVVEWHKNDVPVPSNNGVVSESTAMSSTVSARLTWTRGFLDTDAGSYQCVVYKPNTDIAVTSQRVQLTARLRTTDDTTITNRPCSIQEASIHFQIRVFETNCASWGEAQRGEIANEFRDELLSVVRTECDCTVDDSYLQVSGSAQCSNKVDGAAVFRGQIQTNSRQETERIFCSLYSWQQKSPLVRIDNRLRAVDSNCSLEASDSLGSEECTAPSDPTPILGLTEIVAIAGGGVAFLLLLVIVVLICCAVCCCCNRRRRKKGKFDPKDNQIYARTESFSRYSRGGVGFRRNGRHPGARGEEAVYSTLTQETMDHQSQHIPESIALSHIHSNSSENLINSDSIDGAARAPSRPARTQQPPEAYQIPVVNSRENLTSVSRLDSVERFQAGKQHVHASSSSGYDSTSHLLNRVSTSHPSNSSTDDATNNDYEDISGDEAFSQDSSFCNSLDPTSYSKLHGHGRPSVGSAGTHHQLTETRKHSDIPMTTTFFIGNSSPQLRGMGSGSAVNSNGIAQASGSQQIPNGGRPQRTSETTISLQQTHRVNGGGLQTGSSSSHIMKQELMTQFQSVDHMACPGAGRESNCPEAPPSYTSRLSSEAVVHAESGDSSMMDNAAYGGIDHGQQRPWYYTSDSSLDSTVRQTAPNTREQIQPYAMINNEHIPYPNHKASGTSFNESRVLTPNSRQRPEFQVQSPVQPYAEVVKSSIGTTV